MTKVWIKTQAGQQAFKQRSAQLAGKLRSAFLLCDGLRSPEQVLQATQGLGVTLEDMQALLQAGLLQTLDLDEAAHADAQAGPETDPQTWDPQEAQDLQAPALAPARLQPQRSLQDRYRDAYPLAVALTGKLGLSGFRLNLSVEAATSYQDLAAVAPKIKQAVGAKAFAPLEQALFD